MPLHRLLVHTSIAFLVTTGQFLFAAPPMPAAQGPDWGSDAVAKGSPATRPSAPATRGPDWGSDAIQSVAGTHPAATRGALNPAGIVYQKFQPAAISEQSLLGVFGNDVWDLKTMTRAGKGMNFPRTTDSLTTVMSADGKFVAVAPRIGSRRSATGADVTVYDTATGAKVSEILSALREESVEFVGFAKAPWMLVASTGSPIDESPVELWNFETGKIIRRFNGCFRDAERTTISPDGKWVAMGNEQAIKIYSIDACEAIATMKTPARDLRPGLRVEAIDGSVRAREVMMSTLSIASLAFSPDGKELAALSLPFGSDEARMICWDAKGNIKEDFVFGSSRDFGIPEPGMLQWSPDGSAWMIKGSCLLDRKFKRVVFGKEDVWNRVVLGAFIDSRHYFTVPSRGPSEIIDLPLDAIGKSVAVALDPKAPAILRPGQRISVQLALENPRGDESVTRKTILDAVTARLKQHDIRVAENQSTVLRLTFKEGIGDGATAAVEARAILEFKILARTNDGRDKEFFSESISGRSSNHKKDATSHGIRADLLERFPIMIARMNLPYFIPAQDGLVSLPITRANRHEGPGFLMPDTK